MVNKSPYYSRLSHLIALTHIMNDYKDFYSKLEAFFSSSTDYKDSIYKLYDIVNGNKVYHAKKEKKFYENNKQVIDKIAKYSDLAEYLYYNYGTNSNKSFFYEYLNNNIDKLDDIIDLLYRLKNLGIDEINFVEDLFIDKEYEYDTNNLYGFNGAYFLENMYAIPTYDDNIIKYKTKGSNYKIYTNNKRCIEVNNLVFSKTLLPSIIGNSLIEEIIKLKDNIKDEIDILKTSIILNVTLDDLINQYDITSAALSSLDSLANKKEILNALNKIKKQITRLQMMKNYYNESTKDSINQDILNDEKEKYLKRRKHI